MESRSPLMMEETVNEVLTEMSDAQMMTTAKDEFLRLSQHRENLTKMLIKTSESLEKVMREIGVGQYVQDPSTLVVHKIVVPKGAYQYFKQIDYVRTRKDGETSGDLPMGEATEAGFDLGLLGPKKKK